MLDHIDHNTYLNGTFFSDEETFYMMVMYINSIWVWECMGDRGSPDISGAQARQSTVEYVAWAHTH
jgi:hypothetical protein